MEPQEGAERAPGQNLTGEQGHSCLPSNRKGNISQHPKRGKITFLSPDSRRAVEKAIKEIPHPRVRLDISYGEYYPTTYQDIRRECRRLCSHLRKANWYGIWKIEFQERYSAHFHVLIHKRDDEQTIIDKMRPFFKNTPKNYSKGSMKIIDPDKRETKYIYSYKTNYISKEVEDNRIPFGWHGRFWAKFGSPPPQPPVPHLQVAGEAEPDIPLEPLEDDDYPDPLEDEDENGTVDL